MIQMMKQMIRRLVFAFVLTGCSLVYAEQAPVYDVDGFSGDDSVEQATDVLPPPPESASTEVSNRRQHTSEIPYSAPRQPLDQRMNQMEQSVSSLKSTGSTAKVESLQNEVQQLRGQVEQLSHELTQMKSQQGLQYADLEKRMGDQRNPVVPITRNAPPKKISEAKKKPIQLADASSNANTDLDSTLSTKKPKFKKITETSDESDSASSSESNEKDSDESSSGNEDATAPTSESEPIDESTSAERNKSKKSDSKKWVAQSGAGDAEGEQKLFQSAFAHVKEKRYQDAVNALNKMLAQYPSGQFAASGYSLLGNLHGSLRQYPDALKSYQSLIKQFPNHAKVQDAYYKVGMIYAAQFKWNEAKSAFKKVIARYPNSSTAKLAKEQLKQIKLTGA